VMFLKIDLTYLAQSDKHSDAPRAANGLVKIIGSNNVRDFNFNTIFNIEKYLAYLCQRKHSMLP